MGSRTRILATEIASGESRTYSSLQELARLLYEVGEAEGTLKSINNYLARVSAKGGTVYGLRIRRIPATMDLDTARRFTRVLSAAEKLSALAQRVMDDPTPEVDFADNLEEFSGNLEKALQDHYGELDEEEIEDAE